MAEFKTELVVEGIDLDDESVSHLLEERFPNTLWGSCDEIVTVTKTSDIADPVLEATNLGKEILAVLGPRHMRWNDDLVGYAEISRRSDVTSECVRLWAAGKRRATTFPRPRGYIGIGKNRSPFWRWSDVSIWLDAEIHLGDGIAYPTDEQIAQINVGLASINSMNPPIWFHRFFKYVNAANGATDVFEMSSIKFAVQAKRLSGIPQFQTKELQSRPKQIMELAG